jgi:hypothetical protein
MDRSSIPSAPPPVAAFFRGRVVRWVVLVCACALPLALVTTGRFTPAERSAQLLGALVWVIAMVIIGERLRWPSDARSLVEAMQNVMWNRWTSREADRRSAMLGAGAIAVAIIHSGLAIVTGPPGFFIWFAPAIWIGSRLPLVLDLESDFWNAFTWTLVCGAQTAIVAWICGRARHMYGPRFGSR